MISQTRLKELVSYDPETGLFISRIKRGRGKHILFPGDFTGTKKYGRVYRSQDRRKAIQSAPTRVDLCSWTHPAWLRH
jgi:hypothetical protein